MHSKMRRRKKNRETALQLEGPVVMEAEELFTCPNSASFGNISGAIPVRFSPSLRRGESE